MGGYRGMSGYWNQYGSPSYAMLYYIKSKLGIWNTKQYFHIGYWLRVMNVMNIFTKYNT